MGTAKDKPKKRPGLQLNAGDAAPCRGTRQTGVRGVGDSPEGQVGDAAQLSRDPPPLFIGLRDAGDGACPGSTASALEHEPSCMKRKGHDHGA